MELIKTYRKWCPEMLQMAPQKVANGLCFEFHKEDYPTLTASLLMVQNNMELFKTFTSAVAFQGCSDGINK